MGVLRTRMSAESRDAEMLRAAVEPLPEPATSTTELDAARWRASNSLPTA